MSSLGSSAGYSPATDPFFCQLLWGISGRPGSGKTTMITDLALAKQFVLLLSVDRGIARLRRSWNDSFQKYLDIRYVYPTPAEAAEDLAKKVAFSSTRYTYRRLKQIGERVTFLLSKGVHPGRIWVVVDTMTHLQRDTLREGQESLVDQEMVADNKKDRIQAELTIPPEWNANLSVMARICSYMKDRMPVNLVWLFLERNDKTYKNQYRAGIDIQGASLQMIQGHLDVLYYIEILENARKAWTKPTVNWDAKDRLNCLLPEEDFRRVEDGAFPLLLKSRQMIFPAEIPQPAAAATVPAAASQTEQK